jgi:phosphoribosylglycinamide formyltransferase-1
MARLKLGILISGRGSNLQSLIDATANVDYPAEIVLVISNVAGAQGLIRARTAGLPHATIEHRRNGGRAGFEAALQAALEAAGVELVCLAGFMRLLSEPFVTRWAGRMINVHPSLLPAFKGLKAHERVLEAGVKMTGCTVHFVVPEMDSGPIVAQAAVPVLAGDNADRLAARVLAAEHRLYPVAVRLLADGRARLVGGRVEIDEAGPSGLALLNPSDGAGLML